MNYKEKIQEFLGVNLSEKAFKLWSGINQILPDIWEKPTSSTGKHHRKANGRVPDQAEHAYEMLYAANKLLRMFNYEPKSKESDSLLLAIVLHDSLKYGQFGNRPHTDYNHDKTAADMIRANRETFLKILEEDHYESLEEAVRFHMGRWSTEVPNRDSFEWNGNLKATTFFVHVLDMMSTADLIQTDIREDNDNVSQTST